MRIPVTTEEENGGFDDWGLLGLFSLAGLAGLKKRPEHEEQTEEPRRYAGKGRGSRVGSPFLAATWSR